MRCIVVRGKTTDAVYSSTRKNLYADKHVHQSVNIFLHSTHHVMEVCACNHCAAVVGKSMPLNSVLIYYFYCSIKGYYPEFCAANAALGESCPDRSFDFYSVYVYFNVPVCYIVIVPVSYLLVNAFSL